MERRQLRVRRVHFGCQRGPRDSGALRGTPLEGVSERAVAEQCKVARPALLQPLMALAKGGGGASTQGKQQQEQQPVVMEV